MPFWKENITHIFIPKERNSEEKNEQKRGLSLGLMNSSDLRLVSWERVTFCL